MSVAEKSETVDDNNKVMVQAENTDLSSDTEQTYVSYEYPVMLYPSYSSYFCDDSLFSTFDNKDIIHKAIQHSDSNSDITNDVATYIKPEMNIIENSKQVIVSKSNMADIPFEGIIGKSILADNISHTPDTLINQYVFEAGANSPRTATGHIEKKHSSILTDIQDQSAVNQHVFASNQKISDSFRGDIYKNSSLYVQ